MTEKNPTHTHDMSAGSHGIPVSIHTSVLESRQSRISCVSIEAENRLDVRVHALSVHTVVMNSQITQL